MGLKPVNKKTQARSEEQKSETTTYGTLRTCSHKCRLDLEKHTSEDEGSEFQHKK